MLRHHRPGWGWFTAVTVVFVLFFGAAGTVLREANPASWIALGVVVAAAAAVGRLSVRQDQPRPDADLPARAFEQTADDDSALPTGGKAALEMATLLRTVPTLIWIAHDPACRLVTGNPPASALLQVPEGANTSATPAGSAAPRHYRFVRAGRPLLPEELPLQVAARLGVELIGVDITVEFADGQTRHLLGNAAPLRGAGGAVRGSIAAFMDVTALKQAEAALRDTDRCKDAFLATLAHELRNPLASMKNATQIIQMANGDVHTIGQALMVLDRQLQQLVRHADDLLDLSRIARGKILLCREPTYLDLVLHQATESAQVLMRSRGHELRLCLPDDPLPVEADPIRLTQVFANLLSNAAKYTPPGGRIELSAGRVGASAEVRVSDNGIGIPAEALPRIFDMFSQADRGLERASGGLGIGLALVKGMVELHGGSVEAHSDGPGRGSTFLVRLPLMAAEPPRPQIAAAAGTTLPPVPRCKVLVVDDNADAAESLSWLLEMMGHEVHLAHDGVQGIEAAAALRPDLILMDVGMPRLNGLEATRRIRAEEWGRRITIVALTGLGQETDRRLTEEAGCDAHLTKPVGMSELTPLLAQPFAKRYP